VKRKTGEGGGGAGDIWTGVSEGCRCMNEGPKVEMRRLSDERLMVAPGSVIAACVLDARDCCDLSTPGGLILIISMGR